MNFIMRLLPGSSIRARLLGACGGLALLTALVGGLGTWGFATMNAAFQRAANENLPAVSHLVQADRDMQRALVAQRTLMFMKSDSPAAQEQMKAYTTSFEQIAEHWKAYVVFPARGEETKLRSEFEAAQADWEKSAREVLKLLAQDSTDARKDAIEVSLNEGAEKFEKSRKVLRSLSDINLSAAATYAKAEEARAVSIRWWMFFGIGAALVSAFAVSLVLARSIARPLAETVELLRDIADGEGDLTKRLTVRSKDEIGELARSFNTFVDKLTTIIGSVRLTSTHVTGASQQLSGATTQLASGTQEQAASLEETAASLEEITATVKQNADNARQASQLAGGSRDAAERGGGVVAAAVASMDEITRASKRIADIITVIDEIAFQTNLLALNAAVEAARAGEQGRGFAVVAAEVRNLAQRSAGAAKEIKVLIQDSVAKVEEGSQHVNRSGKTLDEIVQSAKRVADIVAEIAAACQEQSSGIDQVNRAVAQMDRVTQDNAAQTEELSSTSQSLAHQATELLDLVSRFTLPDDESGGLGSRSSSTLSTSGSGHIRRGNSVYPQKPRLSERLSEPTATEHQTARPAGELDHQVAGHPAPAGGGQKRTERRRKMRAEDPGPAEFVETLTTKGANGHTHGNGRSQGNGHSHDGFEEF